MKTDQTVLCAAPRAANWLETTHSARPLHIFDEVINLVNQDDRVLSIVTPAVGNGPFSLMVEEGGFRDMFAVSDSVSMIEGGIGLGRLLIDCHELTLWQPRPAWERFAGRDFGRLTQWLCEVLAGPGMPDNFSAGFAAGSQPLVSGGGFSAAAQKAVDQIQAGFWQAEDELVLQGVEKLAGLGIGLTPAGDDFIIGMLHGLWLRAGQAAARLCRLMVETAIPRTGRLSAAWLEAAGEGEATQVWHALIGAVLAGAGDATLAALHNIRWTGQTSGADALAGFYFILKQETVFL